MNLRLLLLLLLPISLFSCKKGGDDAHDAEMRKLNAWLQVHNITVAPTASGMYYIPVDEGSGANPSANDYFIYNYSVETLSGDIVGTNDAVVANTWGYEKDANGRILHFSPAIRSTLQGVTNLLTPGMYEAFLKMKKGGRARLILPSNLAFGGSGYNGVIGANTTVIINLELVDFYPEISVYEKALVDKCKTDSSLTSTIEGKDEIYYKTIVEKSDKQLKDSAKSVYVKYVGRFLDGYIFDTNIDTVATKAGFTPASTDSLLVEFGKFSGVAAFEEVIKTAWKEEKVMFVTTSEFAYGMQLKGTIPPFTPLFFEVTVGKVFVKK